MEALQGPWDLIVATDVIEHLTDPCGFLNTAYRCGSTLYLETPDWHRGRPTAWKHIKPLEHICMYAEQSLLLLGHRCGWIAKEVHRPIEGKLAVLFKREAAPKD